MPVTASLITGGVGLVQTAVGAIQAGKANKKLDKLFKQRKKFQTPEEIFQILQMEQYASQTGYSPETMQYLTSGADKGLGAALGSATRLGADPNQLGGLLDSYFQDIFRVGNEDELLKMKKFDSLINATQLVAANKEAEWQSQENILKDQMAAISTKVQAETQNLQSGVNTALSALSAYATGELYNLDGTPKRKTTRTSSGGIYDSPAGGDSPSGYSG